MNSWQEQLHEMIDPQIKDRLKRARQREQLEVLIEDFYYDTVAPAFKRVVQECKENGLAADVDSSLPWHGNVTIALSPGKSWHYRIIVTQTGIQATISRVVWVTGLDGQTIDGPIETAFIKDGHAAKVSEVTEEDICGDIVDQYDRWRRREAS